MLKKLYNNYFFSIKERLELEKKGLLFKGSMLSAFTLLALIFEKTPGTFTLYYMFPIGIIAYGIYNLAYANKYKELEMKYWLVIILSSLFYLLLAFCFVVKPINDVNNFIIVFSCLMVFINLIKLFTYDLKSILLYISISLIFIISILSIIFNKIIIDEMYLFFLLYLLLYGIINIVFCFIIKKTK